MRASTAHHGVQDQIQLAVTQKVSLGIQALASPYRIGREAAWCSSTVVSTVATAPTPALCRRAGAAAPLTDGHKSDGLSDKREDRS